MATVRSASLLRRACLLQRPLQKRCPRSQSEQTQNVGNDDDDKPPLRFGDDADGSLLSRRLIKNQRFLMRGEKKRARRNGRRLSLLSMKI
jgi:hypothetical protein